MYGPEARRYSHAFTGACDQGQILNPRTGRCVNAQGRAGQYAQRLSQPCPPGQRRDWNTGDCHPSAHKQAYWGPTTRRNLRRLSGRRLPIPAQSERDCTNEKPLFNPESRRCIAYTKANLERLAGHGYYPAKPYAAVGRLSKSNRTLPVAPVPYTKKVRFAPPVMSPIEEEEKYPEEEEEEDFGEEEEEFNEPIPMDIVRSPASYKPSNYASQMPGAYSTQQFQKLHVPERARAFERLAAPVKKGYWQ